MKGRPAPGLPHPPWIQGWLSRLRLYADRLCTSECVSRHKPTTHPLRGLGMTVESQAPMLRKCSPRPSVCCPVETFTGSLGLGVPAPVHACSRGLGTCSQLI